MNVFYHYRCNGELTLSTKKKRLRCGDCSGCTETEDCRICTNCMDMIKYSGLGKRKQCCMKRKCELCLIFYT